MSGVVEGCTYYNVDGGLRPGESEVSYLRRRPVCLSHGGTKCAEKELAEMVEQCEHSFIVSGPITGRKSNGKSLPDLAAGKDWCVHCGAEVDSEPEFEPKEVFFTKPGDYYVRVPANGGAPEVGLIEAYRRGQNAGPR